MLFSWNETFLPKPKLVWPSYWTTLYNECTQLMTLFVNHVEISRFPFTKWLLFLVILWQLKRVVNKTYLPCLSFGFWNHWLGLFLPLSWFRIVNNGVGRCFTFLALGLATSEAGFPCTQLTILRSGWCWCTLQLCKVILLGVFALKGEQKKLKWNFVFAIWQLIKHQILKILVPTPQNKFFLLTL